MSFIAFASSYGLMIRNLIADDRVHRVPTDDHPRKRNGAYRFDGKSGWVQNWSAHESPIVYRDECTTYDTPTAEQIEYLRRKRDDERERAACAARTRSAEMLNASTPATHAYLARKGFPDEIGYVSKDGRLLIPMWDSSEYGKKLNSLQQIGEDGRKMFLPGSRARGSILRLGSGRETWLCEGYATGLSVRAALKSLYRQATVVVCFSAGNLAHVSQSLNGTIVADNDESGTGERVARSTGRPYWMPPDVGTDANDFHQRYGLRNLAVTLGRAKTSAMRPSA